MHTISEWRQVFLNEFCMLCNQQFPSLNTSNKRNTSVYVNPQASMPLAIRVEGTGSIGTVIREAEVEKWNREYWEQKKSNLSSFSRAHDATAIAINESSWLWKCIAVSKIASASFGSVGKRYSLMILNLIGVTVCYIFCRDENRS